MEACLRAAWATAGVVIQVAEVEGTGDGARTEEGEEGMWVDEAHGMVVVVVAGMEAVLTAGTGMVTVTTGTVLRTGAGMQTRTRARTAAEATAGVPAGPERTAVAGAAVMTATVTRGEETGAGPLLHKDPTPLVDVVEDDEEWSKKMLSHWDVSHS